MFLDKNDVVRAFQEDEFFPFFQPQVRLHTGQREGFEALARWNHARLGVIPPSAFLPLLQRHGLINTLTHRLMGKMFSTAQQLSPALRLSVNISPLQFLDTTIPGRMAHAAADAGFSLERLTIEMTESALIENLPLARSVANELKDLGCKLSLDEFGNGYSSFMHLQALPFDELKLGGSLVRSATASEPSRKIAMAIVDLAHTLGLQTVASGVETAAQASIMNEVRCDRAQGWLFGRPAPGSALDSMAISTLGACAAASSIAA